MTDAKGKTKKRYPLRLVMTPFEKLKSVPEAAPFLKPGVTLDNLEKIAKTRTDNEAAEQLHQAKKRLFQSIHNRSKVAA